MPHPSDPATSWWGDLPDHFRAFARTDGVRAPLYGRITAAAADDPEVLGLLDAAPADQRRAVLLLAAVHDLVLAEPDLDLARWYPSVTPDPTDRPAADPWPAFRALALARSAELRATIATRSVQTNEVGRSLALLPALGLVAAQAGRPLALLEVGASAGLNLRFDRYRLGYHQPGGAVVVAGDRDGRPALDCRVHGGVPVPVPTEAVPVAARVGLDRAPIDVTDLDATRWLEACVFPDRVDRLERLRAAIDGARLDPPRIETGDAVADLARVAATLPADAALCVVHSWALTYVPEPDRFVAELVALASDRPVWWVSVEPPRTVPGLDVPRRDPSVTPEMAGNTITAVVRLAGDHRRDQVLARSHPHLDWIQWVAPGPI
ncbi:MAG TPA: DUF2332 domain-containing protein [Acidimicrobiales bacterium]|nr:DUF2332 domain-containing protein [Acidimicrobiales bacterium]